MFNVRLFIGGATRAASTQATYQRMNPANGELASIASAATPEDADAAVTAAASAFPAWSTMLPAERRRLLLKAADVMEGYASEFVARAVAEAGGMPGWYHFNVALAAGMLREAASMTTQIKGDIIPSNVPGSMAMGIRQACGVVVGIAPWNAPVILGTRAIAMPLACGNTVILKASEICPAVHSLIGQVFQEAGFPEGVVNVITNSPEDAPAIVERLIANPAVKRINFTGSTRVGKIIAQQAAKYLKPVLLELGGKNALIVLNDADVDEAVEAAAFGAFFNQGQICMSTDRILVQHEIADLFVQKLTAKALTLHAEVSGHAEAILGGMVDVHAADRVVALVEDAVANGAILSTGPLRHQGNVVQATVVDHMTPAMRLYTEESFGTVVGILRVGSDDEAIKVANSSDYGLSAAVFSRDITRALAMARRIESGICHVNGPTVHDEAQMPFGGVKQSGYGRFGGTAAINEFTELRWITIQTGSRHYPI